MIRVASSAGRPRGRARDPRIDARVLATAHRHLSALGYQAMSVAAVAEEAGTTRQALYRRWPDKASLAADALQVAADSGPEVASEDPLADLAAELADFQRGVSRPGRLSLVGTMLQDSTAPEARTRYQAQVIAPRRRRIRAILERAQTLGLIDADADLDVAVTMGTGSWYARALVGDDPPPGWPARAAALVWRAVGGATAPDPPPAARRPPPSPIGGTRAVTRTPSHNPALFSAGPADQLLDMIAIPEDAARVPRAILKASRQRWPADQPSSHLAALQWPR